MLTRHGAMVYRWETQSEQTVISSTRRPGFSGSERLYHVRVSGFSPPLFTSSFSKSRFGHIPSLSSALLTNNADSFPNKSRSGAFCVTSQENAMRIQRSEKSQRTA